MKIHRRHFLKSSLAFAFLSQWGELAAQMSSSSPLLPFSANRVKSGPLELPEGFSCRILQKAGDRMDDGLSVPYYPDGMGSFAGPDGTIILMRNHEVEVGDYNKGPYGFGNSGPADRLNRYDKDAFGGVTKLVLDGKTFNPLSTRSVLEGTARNCAGGVSPLGWFTCEEYVDPGSKEHGFVFLCPHLSDDVAAPQRIDVYGRFYHEAVGFDAETSIAYLTEDRTNGCLYRFVPYKKESPFEGVLEALKIVGSEGAFDTGTGLVQGQEFEATWVRIEEAVPKEDTVRREARMKGATLFCRGEGICFDEAKRRIYFSCTEGGPNKQGQIFSYTVIDEKKGTLKLEVQSESNSTLFMPDNLTLSPHGNLFIAEDSTELSHIRILTASGRLMDFAKNVSSYSEMTGLCFSPDGRALFANLQKDGLTVCIEGPFADIR